MKNYVLIILLVLFANSIFAQIQVSQFNAAWNKANEVSWVGRFPSQVFMKQVYKTSAIHGRPPRGPNQVLSAARLLPVLFRKRFILSLNRSLFSRLELPSILPKSTYHK